MSADRRRERVARAIYDATGPSSAPFSDLPPASPLRATAYAAADAAIAAIHGGATRVTRFVAGLTAALIGAAILIGLVGIVIQLGRWAWS